MENKIPDNEKLTLAKIMSIKKSSLDNMTKQDLLRIQEYAGKIAERRRKNFNKKMKEMKIKNKSKAYLNKRKNKRYSDNKERIQFSEYDFTVNKNESMPDLKAKVRNTLEFLSLKTSTFGGYKKYVEKFMRRIAKKSNITTFRKINKNADYFWKLYNRLNELNHFISVKGASREAQTLLYQIIDTGKIGNLEIELSKNTDDDSIADDALLLEKYFDKRVEELYIKNVQQDDKNRPRDVFDSGEN